MTKLTLALSLLIASTAAGQGTPRVPDFRDDLLDRLVGRWEATGTVHGRPSKQTFEAEWVLNHQFLRIHEKTEEIIPAANGPFEALLYIGYDRRGARYVLHSLTVWGAGNPGELVHGRRSGNALTFDQDVAGRPGRTVLTWEPDSSAWRYVGGGANANGEWQVTVDLTLRPARR